jgi:hypothetical protein
MRKYPVICTLAFIVSIITSTTAIAQDAEKDQIKAKTDSGKDVILLSDGTWKYDKQPTPEETKPIFPPKREFKHPNFGTSLNSPYALVEQYDKFSNTSSIRVRFHLANSSQELSFSASTISPGKTIKSPTEISLIFTSHSENWMYLRNSHLTFLVDGEIIDLGQMRRDGNVGRGYVLEFLSLTVNADIFLKIINGKNVEGRLFTSEFKFDEERLEALREFASRLAE